MCVCKYKNKKNYIFIEPGPEEKIRFLQSLTSINLYINHGFLMALFPAKIVCNIIKQRKLNNINNYFYHETSGQKFSNSGNEHKHF